MSQSFPRILFFITIFGAAGVGCNNLTASDFSTVTGYYVLETQDGLALPNPPPAPGSPVPCPVGVTDGRLGIGPATVDFPATYSMVVQASTVCDPNGIPGRETAVVVDGGSWSMDGQQLHFLSSPSYRLGSYDLEIENVSPGPVLTLQIGGHSYRWRRVRLPSDELAIIDIAVVDLEGRQVNGATMVIRSRDGIVERAGSSELHRYATGVSPGIFTIAVAPPPGYTIAPSQANPSAGTAILGQTTTVSIRLVKLL